MVETLKGERRNCREKQGHARDILNTYTCIRYEWCDVIQGHPEPVGENDFMISGNGFENIYPVQAMVACLQRGGYNPGRGGIRTPIHLCRNKMCMRPEHIFMEDSTEVANRRTCPIWSDPRGDCNHPRRCIRFMEGLPDPHGDARREAGGVDNQDAGGENQNQIEMDGGRNGAGHLDFEGEDGSDGDEEEAEADDGSDGNEEEAETYDGSDGDEEEAETYDGSDGHEEEAETYDGSDGHEEEAETDDGSTSDSAELFEPDVEEEDDGGWQDVVEMDGWVNRVRLWVYSGAFQASIHYVLDFALGFAVGFFYNILLLMLITIYDHWFKTNLVDHFIPKSIIIFIATYAIQCLFDIWGFNGIFFAGFSTAFIFFAVRAVGSLFKFFK